MFPVLQDIHELCPPRGEALGDSCATSSEAASAFFLAYALANRFIFYPLLAGDRVKQVNGLRKLQIITRAQIEFFCLWENASFQKVKLLQRMVHASANVFACFIEEYNVMISFVTADDLEKFEGCWKLVDPSRKGFMPTWCGLHAHAVFRSLCDLLPAHCSSRELGKYIRLTGERDHGLAGIMMIPVLR